MKTKVWFPLLVFVLGLPIPSLGLGLKVAPAVHYYAVQDSVYREVYGRGDIMYGLTLALQPLPLLEIAVDGNLFQDKGRMTYTDEEVQFTLRTLAVSLRLHLVRARFFSVYLGAGGDYCFFKEKEPARFGDVSGSTAGYHAEAGMCLNLPWKFYLDLNVRYIAARAKPLGENLEIGGLRAGLGLGLRF
jgi:opacity protein-like surface antigen